MAKDPWSTCQQRHLSFMSEFTTDIRHKAGKDNVVADALSRPAICALTPGLNFDQLTRDQETDEEMRAFKTAITSLRFRDLPTPSGEGTILCDISLGTPRPVVPQQWRRQVFRHIHIHQVQGPDGGRAVHMAWAAEADRGLGQNIHPLPDVQGAQAHQDAHTRVRACPGMVQPHSHGHRRALTHFPGQPLSVYGGGPHHSLARDNLDARRLHQLLLPSPVAWLGRLVQRPGSPHQRSGHPVHICALDTARQQVGDTATPHYAYHLQANGLVERLHCHLKSVLMTHLTGPNWTDKLPWVLLGIRSIPKEDLQASSAELVYGAPLALPGEFVNTPHNPQRSPHELLPHLRARLDSFKPPPPPRHGTRPTRIPGELLSTEFVFVRQDLTAAPLQRPYEGPYRVIHRSSSTFTLDLGGRHELFTMDRLKPAHLDPTEATVVAQPKKRGHPAKKNIDAGSAGVCVAAHHKAGELGPLVSHTAGQPAKMVPSGVSFPSSLGLRNPHLGTT
ncbi:uncharacterized protein [Narcine bancroftii]|uniref:uncharacterized protein n=1 Tax=Narcine bancroftii TaxID=1343680 RepID=UPI0038310DE8